MFHEYIVQYVHNVFKPVEAFLEIINGIFN